MAPNSKNAPTETVQTKPSKPSLVSRDFLRDRSKKDEWNSMNHIIWGNVFWFSLLHVASLYGLYLMFTSAKVLTTLWGT